MVSPLATVPNYTHVITTGTVIHWPSYVGYPHARCLHGQLTILSCRSAGITHRCDIFSCSSTGKMPSEVGTSDIV